MRIHSLCLSSRHLSLQPAEIFFMPHYVYILRSLKDGKYYIDETSNVEARLNFHNSGQQRSTKTEFRNEIARYNYPCLAK